MVTGESFFITTFMNNYKGKQKVAFGAPYPGKIVPVDLAAHKGRFLCQKDSFLCAANGIEIEVAFTRKIGAGLFGGEGFILQRLEGNGLAFVHAGGTLIERELQAGETVKLDTGCLAAMDVSVDYDIEFIGGFKNALFGGEGLFMARLTGPGTVYMQSLPLSRLADRIASAAAFGRQGGNPTGRRTARRYSGRGLINKRKLHLYKTLSVNEQKGFWNLFWHINKFNFRQ